MDTLFVRKFYTSNISKKINLNKQMNECTIKFNIKNSAETIIFTPAHIKSEIKTKIWKMNINEVDRNYTRLHRRGHLHSCFLSKDRWIISWMTVHWS